MSNRNRNGNGSRGQNVPAAKLIVIAGITAVLFAIGLLITERIPEIPVDIDWKPFFIPFAFLALLPVGAAHWAIGLGAALGEGFLDLFEGYEPDDPFGFVGYVVGFVIAGYIFSNDPGNKFKLIVGSIVGAFVQSAIEASGFLVFGEESLPVAIQSALGNTATHGIALGLIPLLIIVPLLHGRIERMLGFAPL